MVRHVLVVTGLVLFLSAPLAAAADGKAVYEKTCATCHDSGLAGAPKLGDEQVWQERMEKGMETLVQHATEGFNTMPAKGGDPSLSDAEVEAAVKYMVGKGR